MRLGRQQALCRVHAVASRSRMSLFPRAPSNGDAAPMATFRADSSRTESQNLKVLQHFT
jgi:hypothetical protein